MASMSRPQWTVLAVVFAALALVAAAAQTGGRIDPDVEDRLAEQQSQIDDLAGRVDALEGLHATTTTTTAASTTTTTEAPTTTSTTAPATTTTTTVPSGGLPAGVTLQDIDGGADYFGQWSNSFPTDPKFFPIGVWAEVLNAGDEAILDHYRDLGVNTFAGTWGNPGPLDSHAVANGQYFVGNGGTQSRKANDTTDEPDLFSCEYYQQFWSWGGPECHNAWNNAVSPESVAAWSDQVRAEDPTRPVYNQFARQNTVHTDCPAWGAEPELAEQYFAASDIVSYDWYTLVSEWIPNACRNPQAQGDAVASVRLDSHYEKPVWFFVETTRIESDWVKPSLDDIEASAWHGIIAGARGLQWFNHCFCTQAESAHVLNDSRYADVQARVADINHKVALFAPILNSPFANGFETSANVQTMVKYYNGEFYIFAIPNDGYRGAVTFDLAAGSSVDVLGEGRSIPVDGGTFVDNFASDTTLHIYKVTS